MTQVLDQLMWTFVSGDLPSENGFKCRWSDCFIGINDPDQLDLHLEEHAKNAEDFCCSAMRCLRMQLALLYTRRFEVSSQTSFPSRRHSTKCCNCPPCPVLQTSEEPFICDWNFCGMPFPDICAFLQHCKEHVKATDPTLFTDQRYYYDVNPMVSVIDTISNVICPVDIRAGRNCACPFCGRYICSTSRLIDHVNRNVEGADDFVCFLCNKGFASQRLLREHCERHVRTVQCPECPLVLQRESDLRMHIDTVHHKNRQFWCEMCSRRSDLNKHIAATHTGQTLRCQHCALEFTWQKQLKHHMLTHEPDYIKSPYLCHICGSTYQRGSALSKHLRTFHKLTVPPGFTRFQFKKCHDNMFRLETERILSDELRKEMRESAESGVDSMVMNRRLVLQSKIVARLLNSSTRQFSLSSRRFLLSNEFALNSQWNTRVDDLKEFNLGTSYEWITSVQKKFIGRTKGSAVDVDAAACLAAEHDQIPDIVDLVYKLRHTENTADMLESTEYAVYRLLLKHGDLKILFKILNDPINYGIFMNEHCCCVAIDQMLKAENFVLQLLQLTFSNKKFSAMSFLNLLSIYSLLKWLELPAEQRVLEIKEEVVVQPEDANRVMEEEEMTFRIPYLRPEHHDDLFDLDDPLKLVTKSLSWLSKNLKSDELKTKISTLVSELDTPKQTDESTAAENGEKPEESKEKEVRVDPKLIEAVHQSIVANKNELEKATCKPQLKLFDEWRNRRRTLIKSQAQALNFRLRLQEINAEQERVKDEIELLNFFKNRVRWEDTAHEKDQLQLKMTDKSTQSRELNTRSKLIAEKISECIHIADHDPTMALYRLQEHIHKTAPILVTRKYTGQQMNAALQSSCCDLENAVE
ncbi:Zinc finger, C2H2 type [Aphelenchoides besseyi]|nr:Zinc finger, C2H2 type [Aphelenchoides besseyi]